MIISTKHLLAVVVLLMLVKILSQVHCLQLVVLSKVPQTSLASNHVHHVIIDDDFLVVAVVDVLLALFCCCYCCPVVIVFLVQYFYCLAYFTTMKNLCTSITQTNLWSLESGVCVCLCLCQCVFFGSISWCSQSDIGPLEDLAKFVLKLNLI